MSNESLLKVDGNQPFKSGIKQMVIHALDIGASANMNDCQITLDDGTVVKFSMSVNVTRIETPSK